MLHPHADPNHLALTSLKARRIVLETIHGAGMGHTGGSLSEIDILVALYFSVMHGLMPGQPENPYRDRFILSKGHASAGFYTVLALKGFFPIEELATFDQLHTRLQAHPDMRKTPGVDISTGSLGQGLSCGLGMAMAAQRLPQENRFTTFVLLGDGETQEGQVWEAALCAGSAATPGIVAIVDCNGVQLASRTDHSLKAESLQARFAAFGWQASIVDGHDMHSLLRALEDARDHSANGPTALIAQTVKGKGVSFMEGTPEWHGKAPNDREYALALSELGEVP